MIVCNEKFFADANDVLETYLQQYHTDGTYLWSQKANDYIEVGAKGFDTYNWLGNSLSFHVDRTFSREYGMDKGFAAIIDLTADKASNRPPISMFTVKNGDMITNKYRGVGGLTGLESGEVASPVAGSKLNLLAL